VGGGAASAIFHVGLRFRLLGAPILQTDKPRPSWPDSAWWLALYLDLGW
jgi:hypothetical protein